MLIYAGIDEAGYGPMLGPLCVGMTVFRLPAHDPARGAPDLWMLLDRVVGRAGSKQDRLLVDDSKKLKGAKTGKAHPLRHLERGVLTFLAATSGSPCRAARDTDIFAHLGAEAPEHGWCAGAVSLPLAHESDRLGIDAARLDRGLRQAGIEFLGARCETIHADRFNREAALFGSKATINFGAMARLVDRLWREHGRAHPRLLVDRHGGRTRYREPLQLSFPEASIRIIAETDQLSRYYLRDERGEITITFMAEAEQHHFPTALASMTAKYTRELFMLRLNRFFAEHLPEVKPTAGYVQDARRYLEELGSVLNRLGIDRRDLVRMV